MIEGMNLGFVLVLGLKGCRDGGGEGGDGNENASNVT